MRKLVIMFSAVFLLTVSQGLALNSFWYSWYASSYYGQLLPNESGTLSVRIKILQGQTIVYQELHTGISTDQFAIFSVNVGTGTVESGNLASVTTQANTRLQADMQKSPAPFVTQTIVGLAENQVSNEILPGFIELSSNKILIGNSSNNAEQQPIGGDLTGTNTGSAASLIINNGAVTNSKIASAAEFVNIQNAAGTTQFSVDNADRGLRFEGTGDVTVGFDAPTNKVSVNFEMPQLPPDLTNEPFLIYSPTSALPNGKVVIAGNAFEMIPGLGDYTYNVLYDNETIGINVSNQLYLLDGAVTASKISDDPATGDKIIQVLNSATTQTIDPFVLPADLVYLSTTPASGDITGNYEFGLNINNDAVTTAKILNGTILPEDLSAGDYTINITGNAATADKVNHSLSNGTGIETFTFDGSADAVVGLTNTGVTAGSYGSSSMIPTFTVDDQGRLTLANQVAPNIAGLMADLTFGNGLAPNGTTFDGSVARTLSVLADGPSLSVAATGVKINLANPNTWTGKQTFTDVNVTGSLNFDAGQTVDGIITTIGTPGLNTNLPTEKAVRDAITASATTINNEPFITYQSSTNLTNEKVLVGGNALTFTPATATLDVNVDNSTIEINADALRVKASGITPNELASTAVTAGSYGSAMLIPTFTVDGDGRLTAAGTVSPNIASLMADLTAANTTLTFSGPYDGSVAQTIGLNLANPNTWTGKQTFTDVNITGSLNFDAGQAVDGIVTTIGTPGLNTNLPTEKAVRDAISASATTINNEPFITYQSSGTLTNEKVLVGGNALAFDPTTATLDVNVDNSTIEINADALRVKASGITPNELASTAVTAGTYGTAMLIPTFNVDSDGRLIAAGTVAPNIAGLMADLTAANTTLTFSGPYDGSVAQTIGLNLANPNTWTGKQTFTDVNVTGALNFDAGQTVDGIVTTIGTPGLNTNLPTEKAVRDAITASATTINNEPFITYQTSGTLTNEKVLVGGNALAFDPATATLDVKVDNSTIEINADALRVKASGITPNELASTAVTAGSYGTAMLIPTFDVDSDGRLIAAGTVAPNIAGLMADLTAANATLTFSGPYDGSVAQTIGLNLANPNTWTGKQTFTDVNVTGALNFDAGQTVDGIVTTIGTPGLNTNLPTEKAVRDAISASATTINNEPFITYQASGTLSNEKVLVGGNALTFTPSTATLDVNYDNTTIKLNLADQLYVQTGNLTTSTTGMTITGGTGAVVGTGATVNVNVANLMADLTAANTTLTFSGPYDGSVAQTIGLNLGNANTWTGQQIFNTVAPESPVAPTDANDLTNKAYVDSQVSGLTTLANGKIYVGDISNTAQEVFMTGDVMMTNTGVTTIQPDAVTSTEIAPNTIIAADIATGAVETTEILDGTILNIDIANNTITNGKLANSTIGLTDAGGITVTGSPIALGASGTLALDMAHTNNWTAIQNFTDINVTGNLQFDNGQSVNNIVTTIGTTGTDLNLPTEQAVREAIAASSSGSNAEPYITFGAATNLTNYRIITPGTGLNIANALSNGGATTIGIAAGGVGTTELANDAVTSAKIAPNTIVAADIATGAVESNEILNGTILDEDIANTTISNGKLVNSTIGLTNGGGLIVTGSPISLGNSGSITLDPAHANTWTGQQTFNSVAPESPITPTDANDLTNKAYVDAQLGGMTTLANGKIYVGDNTNTAQEVFMSGDVSMDNAGVTTVANDSHNHTDATIADNLTINGGTVNATPIGAVTPSTGKFTDVNITGSLNFDAGQTVDGIVTTIGTPGLNTNLPTEKAVRDAITASATTINNEPFITYQSSTNLTNEKVLVGGNGLAFTPSTATLDVNVDNSTIEINADALRVKASGITPNELASTTVTAGSYGSAMLIPTFNVDGDGRLTAAGTVAPNIAGLMADLTAANTTLTFSGPYDGSVAQTIGLNLGNANTWTGQQIFNSVAPESPVAPTQPNDLTNKAYVDAQLGGMTTLANGKIYVGDINNVAQEVTMSGDVTMDNAGVTTVANDSHNHTDATIADNLTINGGTITNSPISGSTGSFTTLSASSTVNMTGITTGDYPTMLVLDNATGQVYKKDPAASGELNNILEVSTGYTALTTDGTILVNCSAGNVLITLPAASTANKGIKYIIQKVDATSNSMTIQPASGTINGLTSRISRVPFQGFIIQSLGTRWVIVGQI